MLPDTFLLGSTTVCYPLSVSPRFTLERALEGISRVGLKYVELVAIPGYCPHLRPQEMEVDEIEQTRDLMVCYNLSPSVINAAADLTTRAGVVFLRHVLRVAQALGIDTVVTHVEQTADKVGEDRFRKLVPEIISLSEEFDVVIALETHGGLVTTGVQGVKFLKEVGTDRLKLTYDMANVVYYAGVLPELDLRELGDDVGRYIGHVHLKDKSSMELYDYDFPAFGTGILDFSVVLRLLYEGGYRGHMSLEVELDGEPESPQLVDLELARSYKYLQGLSGIFQ